MGAYGLYLFFTYESKGTFFSWENTNKTTDHKQKENLAYQENDLKKLLWTNMVSTRQMSIFGIAAHRSILKAQECCQATMPYGHWSRRYTDGWAMIKKIEKCLCIGGLSNKRSSFANTH